MRTNTGRCPTEKSIGIFGQETSRSVTLWEI